MINLNVSCENTAQDDGRVFFFLTWQFDDEESLDVALASLRAQAVTALNPPVASPIA